MKKCWVKVDVHTSYMFHEYKWIKGKLIEYDTFNNMYKVRYNNDGPKVGFFKDDNYTSNKPEVLKKKWDEATKRSWPYATILFVFYVFAITIFFMYGGFPSWLEAISYPFSWIILVGGFNIIHKFFEAEVRQEKILKILEGKDDN